MTEKNQIKKEIELQQDFENLFEIAHEKALEIMENITEKKLFWRQVSRADEGRWMQ